MTDAQDDISKAEDLFLGKNYSRMLLSVNLPNESKETTEFVDFLIGKVKEIFGDDACVTGEIVSTCILMGATIDYGILMSSNYLPTAAITTESALLSFRLRRLCRQFFLPE